MPKVRQEIIVNAPAEKVFAVARQVERFPEVMPDLKSVQVLLRDGNRAVTRWISLAEVGPLSREVSWEEEEWWDEQSLRAEFRLLSGDLQSYGGHWEFARDGGGNATRVVLDFDYEIDLPLLGTLVRKLIHAKMEENCQSLLRALKQLAEEAA